MTTFQFMQKLLEALFNVWLVSEIVIGIATRTRHSSGNVRDRGSQALLWGVILVSVWGGVALGNHTHRNFFAEAEWPTYLSLALLAGGLALRWTAILSLGRSFSSNVAIHATQKVFKSGLYRWMRHPSYTGLLLCFLAVGLDTRNWISLLMVTIPTAGALLYRIHVEEAALREAFGGEYLEYCRVTRRLVPGVY